MAYDMNKFTKLGALKALANRTSVEIEKDRARLTALENVGAQANILEAVKVNGTALTIADKAVDITITEGTTDGALLVNGVSVPFHGASDLFSKVATLIGTDTGKSVRTIANEELAAQLIPSSAKESLDTLTEIAAWIQEHPDDASSMNAAITALQGVLAGIGGEGDDYATVTAYVEAKLSELAIGNYYTKDEVDTELGKKVDAVEGSSLLADTEIARLAAMSDGANKTESSTTNGYIKVDGVETLVYEEPEDVMHGTVAADSEVTEMLNEVFGTTTSDEG